MVRAERQTFRGLDIIRPWRRIIHTGDHRRFRPGEILALGFPINNGLQVLI